MHSVCEVQLVFSTRTKPSKNQPVEVQKILMTNDLSLSAKWCGDYMVCGWQIELFFKELKSTLGFHQYRFRRFEPVEGWDELAQVTILYLEWYRARQLQRRDLSEDKKKWWRWQRTHGLCGRTSSCRASRPRRDRPATRRPQACYGSGGS